MAQNALPKCENENQVKNTDEEQFIAEFIHIVKKYSPSAHLIMTMLARFDRKGYFKRKKDNKDPELQKVKLTQQHQSGGCIKCQK